MRKTGILQCFLNVDMRNAHDGLSVIAKKNGIDPEKIEPGSFIVFINSARTKLKVYASDQVVAYLRLESGRKLNMNVIRELPRVFNGRSIKYDEALKSVVESAISKKQDFVFPVM